MDSSRLSNIFKDNNNSEIKVSDIQCVKLNSIDDNSIKELARGLTKDYIILFISALLVSIFAVFALYDNISSTISDSSAKFDIKTIIFLIIMFLSFSWAMQHFFKEILSTKNSKYKKAQYGIVKSKYSLISSSKNSSRDYNIIVLFPDTNTYIKGVICTREFYESLEEGHPVLVVSFDNKRAYAVIPIQNDTGISSGRYY